MSSATAFRTTTASSPPQNRWAVVLTKIELSRYCGSPKVEVFGRYGNEAFLARGGSDLMISRAFRHDFTAAADVGGPPDPQLRTGDH